MATLPFRPPQFSDDVAWLPPWLQFNQSSSPPLPCQPHDGDLFPRSLQNADSIKGGNNHAKDTIRPFTGESSCKPYNICRLYLSGEDSSPITLTPCEKVLHFNLHLSTDGASSIISPQAWDTSQTDGLNSPEDKALHPVKVLHSPRINSTSNMDNNTSEINLHSPNGNFMDNVCEKTLYNTKNTRRDHLEKCNIKGTECSDINDAVELSVAASEALVIHEIIRTESIPEAMSSAAILELALRMKQARVDGLQDSLCCSEDTDNTSEVLSDLSDSDLEDVYKDIGLSISSLDNILSMDPSVSIVKDTPMTPICAEGEREVQREWNPVKETYFKSRFLARPFENNLDENKAKEFPNVSFDITKLEKLSRDAVFDSILGTACHLGNETSDNIPMNQGYNNDRIDDDHSTHQKLLHSEKTDFNRDSGGGYQSRWLGGWGAKEGNVCGGKESNGAKMVCKMLINETSYLSESTYVAPDQNSVVNYRHSCSHSSEANKSVEDSCKIATRGALASQDVVKDSNSSFIDPLCSMVPCSISSEIVKSSAATKNNDNPRVINAVKSVKIGTKLSLETVRASSGQNGENMARKEHTELNLGDACINPVIRRQTKSLKEYSRRILRNYPLSVEKSFNHGIEEGEESIRDCASAKINEEHEDMRLPAVDQHISCSNSLNEVPDQQPLFRSTVGCSIPTKSQETHFRNSVGIPSDDHCEGSDKNQAQMHIPMQDIPKSPLVLCHKTRRFRASKLPVTDLPMGTLADDQVRGSKNIYDKSREVPQGGLSNTEISAGKRVRFPDADIKLRSNKRLKRTPTFKKCTRVINKLQRIDEDQGITSQEVKERLTNCRLNGRKRPIFQGLDFLLTGFSKKKEQEIEGLLRKHGGVVLSDIPTPIPRPRERSSSRSYVERLPVVLCSRKLQTTTFLYGCAVNAFLLKAGWAYDSIKAGSVLPPDKYEVLSKRTNMMANQIGKSVTQNDVDYIFIKVGIMLHGTHSFCTKFAKVIKHGRGLVYKSSQWLVQSLDKKKISLGAIVVEEESRATRHLKKYASEQKIPVLPASWIVNSLLEGKLLTVQQNVTSLHPPRIKVPVVSVLQDWSQEI